MIGGGRAVAPIAVDEKDSPARPQRHAHHPPEGHEAALGYVRKPKAKKHES
jgi:hypothetical protein